VPHEDAAAAGRWVVTRERGQRRYCVFDTAIGACGVAWSAEGLTQVQLPEADAAALEARLRLRAVASGREEPPSTVTSAIAEIRRYLAGARVDFAAARLDWAGVEPFRQRVYEAARSIGWGRTATYGELARRIGSPGAARDVGWALSRNPWPLVVPCHRILASGGRLGGFSAHGGAATKERLLALEGVGAAGGDAPLLPGILPVR
jgi:methylated-DNA-[protein]-cysteine S-methyltransferase